MAHNRKYLDLFATKITYAERKHPIDDLYKGFRDAFPECVPSLGCRCSHCGCTALHKLTWTDVHTAQLQGQPRLLPRHALQDLRRRRRACVCFPSRPSEPSRAHKAHHRRLVHSVEGERSPQHLGPQDQGPREVCRRQLGEAGKGKGQPAVRVGQGCGLVLCSSVVSKPSVSSPRISSRGEARWISTTPQAAAPLPSPPHRLLTLALLPHASSPSEYSPAPAPELDLSPMSAPRRRSSSEMDVRRRGTVRLGDSGEAGGGGERG